METFGRVLLGLAALLGLMGALALLLSRLGVTSLPGNFVFRGKNVTVYAPIGLSIVLSLLLTLALNLFSRR